jgi:outer membrane immunogenic protein
LEGRGDWANLRASHVGIVNPAFTTSAKVDGIGLMTGQIGYAWNAPLLYLKGGAAVTSNRFDVLAAGVGPNWSAGLAYDEELEQFVLGRESATCWCPNRISQDVDMVTIRGNYRFGGPVMSKYRVHQGRQKCRP